MDRWRSTLVKLVIFELIVCAVFIVLGYTSGSDYFRGVGIGLLIAWVTGALAYFIVKGRVQKSDSMHS